MTNLLPATWLGWLAWCALLIANYFLWRLLSRMVGLDAGLGRPATAEEVVVWGLGRVEKRLEWWKTHGGVEDG